MGEITKVSWTDSTWNPWIGCRAVSPGCQNCYARTLVNGRMGGDFSKRRRTAPATFNAPLRWQNKPWVCDVCGEATALRGEMGSGQLWCAACGMHTMNFGHGWHKRRVFQGSLMDIFDPETPIEWLADALDIIRRCPDLIFQCVTKRPELWRDRMVAASSWLFENESWDKPTYAWMLDWQGGKAPKNIWVIASVEDQKRADERIPELLKIPAVVHGLSIEPLLESIQLVEDVPTEAEVSFFDDAKWRKGIPGIEWVIVGGESGPDFRDRGVEAIEDVARQCKSAGVPLFVKQDAGRLPGQQGRISDETWGLKQFPERTR